MPSTQSIKLRISAIKSTKQITQAMELVAATKMRKAQETALASRGYAIAALELLADISQAAQGGDQLMANGGETLGLLAVRPIKKTAILIITSDKGLAGSYNASVFKKLEKFMAEQTALGQKPEDFIYLTVGQKATDYVKRREWKLEYSVAKLGDAVHFEDTQTLAEKIIGEYAQAKFDQVLVFSTNFTSALKQEVIMRTILPIDFARIRQTVEDIIPQSGRWAALRETATANRPSKPSEYIIEPSPHAALSSLLPLLFKMQIYHMILEANASEHSARRLAMKNASDNAGDLISYLTLLYNRQRQSSITTQIIEITGAAAAMNR